MATAEAIPQAPKYDIQCFGRKKTSVDVARLTNGKGLIKVKGVPIELYAEARGTVGIKCLDPIKLLRAHEYFPGDVNIRVRVNGGGTMAQIAAVRQAISKSIVAYYQKHISEANKEIVKTILLNFDRTLLVADPRRCESKKFGGPSARTRYQKSYR